ncbi:hypothetical protein [Ramlibacter sp.]|uniref:hypothetical protein n=1 Tax=Ramlibacter sp. TaxID=1917967 RepID=UPI003D116B1D
MTQTQTPREFHDSDPSFIRRPAHDLFDWGGRIGLTHREMLDAVADGLIRPADAQRLIGDEKRPRPAPDITLP